MGGAEAAFARAARVIVEYSAWKPATPVDSPARFALSCFYPGSGIRGLFSRKALYPHLRKPILLILAQTMGFSIPCLSSTSRRHGRFTVMKALQF